METSNMDTNLSKVFSLFLSKDQFRPEMQNPFEFNGYTYATNGCILVRCKKEHIDFEFQNDYEPPNPESVIFKKNANRILDVDKIDWEGLMTEDDFNIIDNRTECEVCNGEGEVEYEFSHNGKDYYINHDCPVCEGKGVTGEYKKVPNGGKRFPNGLGIKIGHLVFVPEIIYPIKKVKELMDEDVFLVAINEGLKPIMIKCGILEILIAPCYLDYEPTIVAEI